MLLEMIQLFFLCACGVMFYIIGRTQKETFLKSQELHDVLMALSQQKLSIRALRNPEEFDINVPIGTFWANTKEDRIYTLIEIKAVWKEIKEEKDDIK